jgi:signal transduction histidine kinase
MTRKILFAGGLLICLTVMGKLCFAQYHITHLSTENGLPSNGIKGLQWDEKTGFLWIATEAGVARYNGIGFRIFDNKTNPGLGSGRIVFAGKNYKGKIFIGGEAGSLLAVNNNLIEYYFDGGDKARNNYNHYAAVSASDTLFKKCFNNPWSNAISVFKTNKVLTFSDTALILFAMEGLYYYSVNTPQPKPIDVGNYKLKSAFSIGERQFVVDENYRFYSFNWRNKQFHGLPLFDQKGNLFVFNKDNSTIIWEAGMESPIIIQDGKAWEIDGVNESFLRANLIAENLPENAQINYAQYFKKGKYFFLGTVSKGVFIIHQDGLIPKHPAVSNINQINSFYSQIELPNGNVITNEGRIIGEHPSAYDFNIGSFFYNSVFRINDSIITFSRYDTIFSYNVKTTAKKVLLNEKTTAEFSVVPYGNELIIACKYGIGTIGKDLRVNYLWKFDSGLSYQFAITAMMEISPGRLLISSCEKLLSFDISTKKMDTLLDLPGVCIRNLYKEGPYVFIGTYGDGYYIMKDNIIKPGPLDFNKYLKNTHCFIKDSNGYCWMSTNNGLFKSKMSDILNAYESGNSRVYFHYLGMADGMAISEMNGGCTPCAIALKNGYFSFPTMDGLLWFDPLTTNINLPEGEIYIDKLTTDGIEHNVENKNEFQIGNEVQNIDLFLAVSAWCRKENLFIEYQLDDKPWLTADKSGESVKISFNNIPYGAHSLKVRKPAGFGTDNYSYLNLSILIPTPFYHQWWFRGLMIIAAAGFIYLLLRIRLVQYEKREEKLSQLVEEKTMDLNIKNAQLEKNDEIKTRLIAVINHDIITPLKFMHYAGKALVENKDTITREEKIQTISEITQTAKDMEMLSSQILNWIIYQNPSRQMQKEEFDLHHLVGVVFGVLQFSARQKTTLLANKVAPNFVVFQYLEPLRVMLYNLVMNSLNFTKDGQITVNAARFENKIIINVADTGLGMSEEQVDNLLSENKIITSPNIDNRKGTGLGYMIIKDLIKMMDGEILIQSGKMKGTTVTVKLPAS